MKIKILIVDDKEYNRIILRYYLNDKFDIIEAENGKIALNYLSDNSVNLIITDLHMPVMDGIELTQNIRKKQNSLKLPIIMLTSDDSIQKKEKIKLAKINDLAIKPISKKKLIKMVDNHI